MERPRFALTVANTLGKPIEILVSKLPAQIRERLLGATHHALEAGLTFAIESLAAEQTRIPPSANFDENTAVAKAMSRSHTAATTLLGGLSGFFGGWAVGIELPLTTTLMLRSIADTAQRFGEDLSKPETKIECLTVFAYGTRMAQDDAVDTSYYTARFGLQQLVQETAKILIGKSSKDITKILTKQGAPIVVRLLSGIAARFNVVVSEKFAAQAIPVVGAIGGASINALFTEHFNRVAIYHFGLKNLERRHGTAAVEEEYRGSLRVIDIDFPKH